MMINGATRKIEPFVLEQTLYLPVTDMGVLLIGLPHELSRF